MGTKSIYYGLSFNNPGTPFQQWTLSELPISKSSVITSSSIAPIATGGNIPISGIIYNKCNLEMTPVGELIIRSGLYKIEYRLNVLTAGTTSTKVSTTLLSNGSPISIGMAVTSADSSGNYTAQIMDSAIIKIGCCSEPVSLLLSNSSATTITPILIGSTSVEMIITKL